MSNPVYFCHQCNRQVRSRESDLKCSDCGGEFIEEIDRPPFQFHLAGGAAPQGDRPRSAAASRPRPYPQDPRNQGPVPMIGSLNNLMNMLYGNTRPSQANREAPRERTRTRTEPTNPQGRPPRPPNYAEPQHPQGQANVHDSFNQFFTQLISGLGAVAEPNVRIHLTLGGDGPGGGAHMFAGNFADLEQMQLDQIVTNLLNSFESHNTTLGLSPDVISRIPRVKVNQKHVDNDTQCTTCMESFKKDETVLEINCRHIFHQDCLLPWFERHRTCPICRQEVDPAGFSNAQSEEAQPNVAQAQSATSNHANLQNDMDLD